MNLNYNEALDNLIIGIGNSYKSWSDNKEGRTRFIESLSLKSGRKFDKVMHGSSVWGFIAKKNGEHKGIPYFTGDVFMAATWRAPAKHVRGSIFYDGSDWYQWTGPNYL